MRPVTLLLSGVPQFVTLHDLSVNLDLLFNTDEIETFKIRDLPNHPQTYKRQIALDFRSGYDAMAAQEKLEGYTYELDNGREYTLHAKINKCDAYMCSESTEYEGLRWHGDDWMALATIPNVSDRDMYTANAKLDAQLKLLKKQRLVLDKEKELLREKQTLKRKYGAMVTSLYVVPTPGKQPNRNLEQSCESETEVSLPKIYRDRCSSSKPPRSRSRENRPRKSRRSRSKDDGYVLPQIEWHGKTRELRPQSRERPRSSANSKDRRSSSRDRRHSKNRKQRSRSSDKDKNRRSMSRERGVRARSRSKRELRSQPRKRSRSSANSSDRRSSSSDRRDRKYSKNRKQRSRSNDKDKNRRSMSRERGVRARSRSKRELRSQSRERSRSSANSRDGRSSSSDRRDRKYSKKRKQRSRSTDKDKKRRSMSRERGVRARSRSKRELRSQPRKRSRSSANSSDRRSSSSDRRDGRYSKNRKQISRSNDEDKNRRSISRERGVRARSRSKERRSRSKERRSRSRDRSRHERRASRSDCDRRGRRSRSPGRRTKQLAIMPRNPRRRSTSDMSSDSLKHKAGITNKQVYLKVDKDAKNTAKSDNDTKKKDIERKKADKYFTIQETASRVQALSKDIMILISIVVDEIMDRDKIRISVSNKLTFFKILVEIVQQRLEPLARVKHSDIEVLKKYKLKYPMEGDFKMIKEMLDDLPKLEMKVPEATVTVCPESDILDVNSGPVEQECNTTNLTRVKTTDNAPQIKEEPIIIIDIDSADKPVPSKPQFVVLIKSLLKNMTKVIRTNKLGGEIKLIELKHVLRHILRKMLKGQGFLPREEIIRKFRKVYPMADDEQFVRNAIKDIKDRKYPVLTGHIVGTPVNDGPDDIVLIEKQYDVVTVLDSDVYTSRLVPLSPKFSSDDGIHEELRELFKNSRETYSDFSIFSNKPSICIQKVAFRQMELVQKTKDGHPKTGGDDDVDEKPIEASIVTINHDCESLKAKPNADPVHNKTDPVNPDPSNARSSTSAQNTPCPSGRIYPMVNRAMARGANRASTLRFLGFWRHASTSGAATLIGPRRRISKNASARSKTAKATLRDIPVEAKTSPDPGQISTAPANTSQANIDANSCQAKTAAKPGRDMPGPSSPVQANTGIPSQAYTGSVNPGQAKTDGPNASQANVRFANLSLAMPHSVDASQVKKGPNNPGQAKTGLGNTGHAKTVSGTPGQAKKGPNNPGQAMPCPVNANKGPNNPSLAKTCPGNLAQDKSSLQLSEGPRVTAITIMTSEAELLSLGQEDRKEVDEIKSEIYYDAEDSLVNDIQRAFDDANFCMQSERNEQDNNVSSELFSGVNDSEQCSGVNNSEKFSREAAAVPQDSKTGQDEEETIESILKYVASMY